MAPGVVQTQDLKKKMENGIFGISVLRGSGKSSCALCSVHKKMTIETHPQHGFIPFYIHHNLNPLPDPSQRGQHPDAVHGITTCLLRFRQRGLGVSEFRNPRQASASLHAVQLPHLCTGFRSGQRSIYHRQASIGQTWTARRSQCNWVHSQKSGSGLRRHHKSTALRLKSSTRAIARAVQGPICCRPSAHPLAAQSLCKIRCTRTGDVARQRAAATHCIALEVESDKRYQCVLHPPEKLHDDHAHPSPLGY